MTLDLDPKTEIITLNPTQPLLIFSGGEPLSLAILWPFLQLLLVSALEDLGDSSVPIHTSQHFYRTSSPPGTGSGCREDVPGSTRHLN